MHTEDSSIGLAKIPCFVLLFGADASGENLNVSSDAGHVSAPSQICIVGAPVQTT